MPIFDWNSRMNCFWWKQIAQFKCQKVHQMYNIDQKYFFFIWSEFYKRIAFRFPSFTLVFLLHCLFWWFFFVMSLMISFGKIHAYRFWIQKVVVIPKRFPCHINAIIGDDYNNTKPKQWFSSQKKKNYLSFEEWFNFISIQYLFYIIHFILLVFIALDALDWHLKCLDSSKNRW